MAAMIWINNRQKRKPSAIVTYRRRKRMRHAAIDKVAFEERNVSFMSRLSRRLTKLFAKKGK